MGLVYWDWWGVPGGPIECDREGLELWTDLLEAHKMEMCN